MTDQSTIVLPWDFSLHAIAALEYAQRHFRAEQVHVICVLDLPDPVHEPDTDGPAVDEEAEKRCREKFRQIVAEAGASGLSFVVAHGDPAHEIVKLADARGADFIVMSTHGRTGIRKLFMGSVAQGVIARSRVPILLLPIAGAGETAAE